jgi:hypothetical protein
VLPRQIILAHKMSPDLARSSLVGRTTRNGQFDTKHVLPTLPYAPIRRKSHGMHRRSHTRWGWRIEGFKTTSWHHLETALPYRPAAGLMQHRVSCTGFRFNKVTAMWSWFQADPRLSLLENLAANRRGWQAFSFPASSKVDAFDRFDIGET